MATRRLELFRTRSERGRRRGGANVQLEDDDDDEGHGVEVDCGASANGVNGYRKSRADWDERQGVSPG